MIEIILITIFIVILVIGYLYFKYRFSTTSFFIFAIGQLVFVTLMFYLKPFRELLLITLVGFSDKDISFLASPPFYIYLLFDVTLIAIMFLFVKVEASKTKEFIDTQTNINDLKDSSKNEENSEDSNIDFKIEKPKAFKTEEIFYKRVKRIFELTNVVENELSIDLSSNQEVLYGKIKNLDEYINIFINCDSTIKGVNESKIDKFIEWINNYTLKNGVKNYKAYYIVLNSNSINEELKDIAKNSDIKTFKESELLDSLISIDSYLNRLIDRYSNDTLPFSIRSEKDKKFSLKDTFVSPSFNREDFENIKDNLSLDDFLDEWLNQDSSNRQISILGGYGMGKSSFLLHYATKLAERYKIDKSGRIPIFVPLTNVTPMLDFGLKDRLSNIASDMNINYEMLMYLIEMKRVVLLLDGFDEMGYVGNNEFRLKHFESIWQLATEGNKIIIAGRPSYFFTETELNRALQAVKDGDLISDDSPHCRLVKLQRLSNDEIKEYLIKYYPNECLNYLKFLKEQKQLIDLASRPSLMHIIREMLPEIYKNYRENTNNKTLYSAGYLMEKYANHWIKRQTKKDIKGSLEDEDKDNFFQNLAEKLYITKSEVVTPEQILEFMSEFLTNMDLSDKDKNDGIQGDILSGSFLQRQITGGYKFVHRSFFEYFVAKKIVHYIKSENSNENEFPKIFFIYWREEIASFVADLLDKGYEPLPKNLYENRAYGEVRELFTNLAEVEFKKKDASILRILNIKANFLKLSNINIDNKKDKILLKSDKRLSFIKDKSKDNLVKLFKIAIVNSINVHFFRQDETKEFISNINFIYFYPQIFRKSDVLINADLSYTNLNRVNLNGANLSGANLSGANLRIADLNGADLNGANLSEADLIGADLRRVNLEKAYLMIADLNGADLNGANLRRVNLEKAYLMIADLNGADLSGANLRRADLRRADLRRADLDGADLREADLSGVDLREANLREANLREANLRGADLRGADLREADLRGTNLEKANLSYANLTKANLKEADLTKADLTGADLTGASLIDTKLDGAILDGVKGLNKNNNN